MKNIDGCIAPVVHRSKWSGEKEVYLIGTIHSMHLDAKNNYSMTDLLNQIKN